jgi:hypothetical protein
MFDFYLLHPNLLLRSIVEILTSRNVSKKLVMGMRDGF